MNCCAACTKPARTLTNAVVKFDNEMVIGKVGACCAKLGVLMVVVDGAAPAPATPAAKPARVKPQTPTGLPKLEKVGFGLRQLAQEPARAAASLSKGEALILSHLVVNGPLTRRQVSLVTGYTKNTRNAYLLKLSQAGFVAADDDRFAITPDGEAQVTGDLIDLPRLGSDLLAWWLPKLPAGERCILVLFTERDDVRVMLTRAQVSQRTGYTKNTRNTYLLKLSQRFLIEKSGGGTFQVARELFAGAELGGVQ